MNVNLGKWTLQTRWQWHLSVFRTRAALVPTIVVLNWMPRWSFYHLAFAWVGWTWDVHWMKRTPLGVWSRGAKFELPAGRMAARMTKEGSL